MESSVGGGVGVSNTTTTTALTTELQEVNALLEEARMVRARLTTRRHALLRQLSGKVSRQALEQRALRAAGMCSGCRKPLDDTLSRWHCSACRQKIRERAQDKTGCKPWQPGSKGRPPLEVTARGGRNAT